MTFNEYWSNKESSVRELIINNHLPICLIEIIKGIAESTWNASKTHWIKCKDRLPGFDEYVLWKYQNGFVVEGCIDKDDDIQEFLKGREYLGGNKVKWMPVPEDDDEYENDV